MTKLWIAVHHHKHGVDVSPIYQEGRPDDEELLLHFDDFEPDKEEYIDACGPFDLPGGVPDQDDLDTAHYTLVDVLREGKDWRNMLFRLSGYPLGPLRPIDEVGKYYAKAIWPVTGKFGLWHHHRFVYVGEKPPDDLPEHVEEPDVRVLDI